MDASRNLPAIATKPTACFGVSGATLPPPLLPGVFGLPIITAPPPHGIGADCEREPSAFRRQLWACTRALADVFITSGLQRKRTFAEPLYPLKCCCDGMAAEPWSADIG